MSRDLRVEYVGAVPFELPSPADTIEGAAKCGQQFLLLLFTEVGTDPTDLSRGTIFPRLLGAANVDRSDLLDIVAIAVESASEQLLDAQLDADLPDEETFATATVEGIVLEGDRLTVRISITNANGDLVPVAVSQE